MRRLEHADEDKFWEAWIKDDTIFMYRFGKIGSAGQTRLKRHATKEDAEADLEENVGRKLKEGFKEKGADSAPDSDSEPTPPKPVAVRRVPKVQPELVSAARSAIEALQQGLGARSWKVRRLGRRARQMLERIHGADPAKTGFGDVFDALMHEVVVAKKRLPLEIAMGMLLELDSAVFVRTVKSWKSGAANAGPAKEAIGVLHATVDAIPDPDVALRVGAAIAERQLDAASWRKRFHGVKPELEETLKKNGSTFAKYLKLLDAPDDAVLAGRIEEAAR